MAKKISKISNKEPAVKKKYLINGFRHMYDSLVKDDTYEYTFDFPKSSRWDFWTNAMRVKRMIKSKEIEKYDILHLNCWESLLVYSPKKYKKPGQITIAEAHGFFVGVNFMATVKELPIEKRIPNYLLKLAYDGHMQKRIREYDIFYVSTPNMMESALKIRSDAMWLPNPIDTNIFKINGPKVHLEGNPSVFLPTRLHAFKNPLFGVNLFKKIKEKYPEAKLHMINYGQGADPLFNAFKKLVDEKEVVYHNRMPKDELAKHYRSADIVLGQFNPVLGNLSLVEIEAMACGAPIVTLDKYELKGEFESLDKLEKLAFKIIEDKKFRPKFVKRNHDYVMSTHSEKAVYELNNKTIKDWIKKHPK